MLELNNHHPLNSFKQKDNLFAKYQLLSQFCKNLDPYIPLTEEQLEILNFFSIPYTENPFELTNNLLQKLMELEEQLK